MVTTRFVGRAGNSFYQVAACIAYAKKFGYEWAVPRDPIGETGMRSAIHNIFPDLPKTNDHFNNYPRNGYDPQWYDYFEMTNQGPDVLLAGFWQSYKWFDFCADEVKKVFHQDKIEGYEDYVSIHVRRGDFVKYSGSFPPVTMDYVEEALSLVAKSGGERTKIFVFSDDLGWCKSNFNRLDPWFDFTYSEGKSEREDLELMRSCGHHIISNSSFAWWAAWLGHNPNRIVISPHHTEWYGPENGVVKYAKAQGKEACTDLIPPEWIQIKFRHQNQTL